MKNNTSDGMSKLISQWNIKLNDCVEIVDFWNDLSNRFPVTVEEIIEGLLVVSESLKERGLDFFRASFVVADVIGNTREEDKMSFKNYFNALNSEGRFDNLLSIVNVIEESMKKENE